MGAEFLQNMGVSGFVWFYGVVNDRTNDPLKLGRVRVRILGHMTGNTQVIPVDHLAWSKCLLDVLSSGPECIGWTPLGITEAAWVWGFYEDGANSQAPVVVGVIPGTRDQKAGSDPTGTNEGQPGWGDPRSASAKAAGPKKLLSIKYNNGGVTGECIITQGPNNFV